ncbi:hypothetical protein [Kibdelosporangium philippinense]|uniref:hypothetical protein n=1 Tax=Kibdelosporangium philippinense TaxID=211113 RepID=UPI003624359E
MSVAALAASLLFAPPASATIYNLNNGNCPTDQGDAVCIWASARYSGNSSGV